MPTMTRSRATQNPNETLIIHLQLRNLLPSALELGADLGPTGEDGGGEAAARSEFTAHEAPFGLHGGDDVAQHSVDGVFVEDAQAAVGEEIHFQGFQLDAIFLRHVLDGDGAEVGETGFRADGGVLGKARGNNVAGKLIGPGLERGQFGVDAGASVFFGVVGHECSSRLLYRESYPGTTRLVVERANQTCSGGSFAFAAVRLLPDRPAIFRLEQNGRISPGIIK